MSSKKDPSSSSPPTTPSSRRGGTTAKRRRVPRVRCGECDACQRADCGKCRCCIRKKKFGGDDTCKEACIHRRCKNLRERTATTASSGGTSSPSTKKAKLEELEARNPIYMYGIKQPKCITDACAGCNGTRNVELKDESILLCDGKGCSREYHMSCCIPPLTNVPEGSFYCVDCDPVGITYRQLEEYFEAGAEARAEYSTSREYVESLLIKNFEELSVVASSEDEDGDDTNDDSTQEGTNEKKPNAQPQKPKQQTTIRIPNSELWSIAESHQNAMLDTEKFISSMLGKNKKGGQQTQTTTTTSITAKTDTTPKLRPDFLVGKPLRLYCPEGNNYHDGRIVDWRKATHLHPIGSGSGYDDDDDYDDDDKKKKKKAFYGNTDVSDCEFYVRFVAGGNHRKKTMHTWIILEEHSLAVGVSVIWGEFVRSKGINAWKPAQTLLRTSLELLPVSHLLNEELGQISFTTIALGGQQEEETKEIVDSIKKSSSKEKEGKWALAKQFGHESYSLLDLENESVDFFSEGFSRHFFNGKSTSTNSSSATASNKDGEQSESSRMLELSMALAFAETEEERRIRAWYSMPLNNAAHERALSIVDEGAQPPMELTTTTTNNNSKEEREEENPHQPQPCPTIERGLDRHFIMELLGKNENVEKSLDTGASLTCELVGCSSAKISEFRAERKERKKSNI